MLPVRQQPLIADRKLILRNYVTSGGAFVDIVSGFPADIIAWHAGVSGVRAVCLECGAQNAGFRVVHAGNRVLNITIYMDRL